MPHDSGVAAAGQVTTIGLLLSHGCERVSANELTHLCPSLSSSDLVVLVGVSAMAEQTTRYRNRGFLNRSTH